MWQFYNYNDSIRKKNWHGSKIQSIILKLIMRKWDYDLGEKTHLDKLAIGPILLKKCDEIILLGRETGRKVTHQRHIKTESLPCGPI